MYDQANNTAANAYAVVEVDQRASLIADYSQAADALRDAVNEITMRLHPVLKPDYGSPENASVPGPEPVKSDGRQVLDAIREQTYRLSVLLDRLEV